MSCSVLVPAGMGLPTAKEGVFGRDEQPGSVGWGVVERFGHAGRRPPPDNPNYNFGFDFFGTTKSRFNYR